MAPRILLADDSVTVQKVIELTFSDEGMQVVAVGDGREAIARLDADPPDIVLADVDMPDVDGYAVAEHVKRTPALGHVPVVLMTGAFEQLDEARAREIGCDGVLAKPFEPQMVIALVRELLAKARGEQAPADGVTAGAPVPAASPAAGHPFEAGVQTRRPAPTLDDYFDRIDDALSHAEHPGRGDADSEADTLITVVSTGDDRPRPDPAEPAARAQPVSSPVSSLADAFSALLADELGEAPLPAAWASVASGPGDAQISLATSPALTEDALDEIARRVAERLSHAVVQEVVAARVVEVAERLVREEIERLKAGV
jgi:CheY-like chemotaxis protein